jgi:hypothetical protein
MLVITKPGAVFLTRFAIIAPQTGSKQVLVHDPMLQHRLPGRWCRRLAGGW